MQPKSAAWRCCDNGAERRKLPSVARGDSARSTSEMPPPLLMLATVDESGKVTRAARPASSAEPALQVAIAPRSADTTTTTSARARRAAGALSRHAARRRQAIGTSRRRKVHHARKPDSLAERDCCCRRQRHERCRLGRGHRRQSRFVFLRACDLYRLPFCARVYVEQLLCTCVYVDHFAAHNVALCSNSRNGFIRSWRR